MKFIPTYITYYEPYHKKIVEPLFEFDLQCFNGEKTEEATPKKRQDAKNKGQVSRSNEISSTFIILIAFLALKILGQHIYDEISNFTIHIFTNIPQEGFTADIMGELFINIMLVLVKTALPIMLAITATGLIINYFQVGFLFTFEPIMPSLSKLDPIEGFKRMFSKRSLVELIKSIIKIVVIGYFIVLFLREESMHLPKLMGIGLMDAMHLLASLIFTMVFKITAVMMILSILDYYYQKWEHGESLKMSKQEVKEEYKQSEGNPQIKGKIKERQRAMAMQRMMKEIPKADVVITNPTHFAVAIKYEKGMAAPIVVAKGQDLIAKRIREIAQEAKVTIVENKPLARALYSSTEIGDIIPPELYKSVAEVLAHVYKIKKKLS